AALTSTAVAAGARTASTLATSTGGAEVALATARPRRLGPPLGRTFTLALRGGGGADGRRGQVRWGALLATRATAGTARSLATLATPAFGPFALRTSTAPTAGPLAPRSLGAGLDHRQGDSLALAVHAHHPDGHDIADAHDVVRALDVAVGKLADVDQAGVF